MENTTAFLGPPFMVPFSPPLTISDRETLLHDAIKALFITKPSLRYEIALDHYRNKEISLGKAAETAGLTIEEFKELLESRGIKVEISSSKEESDISHKLCLQIVYK